MAATLDGPELRQAPRVVGAARRRPARARPDPAARLRRLIYLLDTNTLSQGAPTKEADLAFADLADWLETAADHLWLSVVTIAEIMAGIERSTIRGEPRKAGRLRVWLDIVEHLHGPRILPLDRDAARLAGTLPARARMAGASPGLADAAIAATAELRGFRVVTRNAKDFAPMGVAFVNPYETGLPPIPG